MRPVISPVVQADRAKPNNQIPFATMPNSLSVDQPIQYFQTKAFEKSLQAAMLNKGAQGRRSALKVKAVLGSLSDPDPFKGIVKVTNHGESRIPHCVKYDLGEGWRLITCQYDKTCGFLFVGNHADAEHWLDENSGQTFAVDRGRATLVPGVGATIPFGKSIRAGAHPLYELLPSDLAEHVLSDIPRRIARRLEALDTLAGTKDLDEIVGQIEDPERAGYIEAVFNQLIAGNVEGAETIIKLQIGLIQSFEELDAHELLEVQDGPEIRRLRIGSPEYEQWLNAFEKRSAWFEWFLFLHPEQEKVVNADYTRPAQLSGVSGSGKTCVAVRRALRLAERDDAKVLLVTLNRSLAGLLQQLVDAADPDGWIKQRIEVTSFFELAQRLLLAFEPWNAKLYSDVTWKLGEHVDEVFREYYRCWLNSHAAQVLVPLHISLNARGVNGEVYLREEFDWIRSAVEPEARKKYLELERSGRRFPIPKDKREEILKGLEGWERKMRDVGVVDYLGLTSALSRHLSKIDPQYTNIIIDEAQDFGTTELRVIRKLVAEGPNDLFLCGDVAQTILPKHRVLAEAGIPAVTRERITQNYRNSREILKAAFDVLMLNLHDDIVDSKDLEILDPKFANYSGPAPMALFADTLEEEIAYARTYADTRLAQGARTVCIAFAGYSTRDIDAFAKRCGVTALDGAYDPNSDRLVFSDLEQTKGYEFEVLIIVQCKEGILPPQDAPIEEAHRAACKLYVAMTRAKRELILSYNGTASPWITAVSDSIGVAGWAEFELMNAEYLRGVPELLPELQPGSAADDAFKLTGRQFVYTSYACGLSLEAQQKLIDLADGHNVVRGGTNRRVKWPHVGALVADLEHSRSYDAAIGPVVADELRGLATQLRSSRSDRATIEVSQ